MAASMACTFEPTMTTSSAMSAIMKSSMPTTLVPAVSDSPKVSRTPPVAAITISGEASAMMSAVASVFSITFTPSTSIWRSK